MATPEPTLTAVMTELSDIKAELRVMTEFVTTLQAVLAEMAGHPMLRAMGMGNQLEGLITPNGIPGMVQLPGMPSQ